jgi:glycosyltransferase involved in cell wall biosynthesis
MTKESKVSAIMASCLLPYPNAAQNREKKFLRAVKSFLNQTYPHKELIIIADGCTKTYELYEEHFGNLNNVECIIMQKQTIYSGAIRTEGLQHATGDIIAYLDSDDVWGAKHLETIVKQFTSEVDWVYYNDYLVLSKDFKKFQMREVEPRFGSIGTSSIAHRNLESLKEKGIFSDGYGHDWLAVLRLTSSGLKFKKLKEPPRYLVCHWGMPPQGGDF